MLFRRKPLLRALATVLVLSSCQQSRSLPMSSPSGIPLRGQFPDGRIDLADGSLWLVQPAGQSASLRWRPGDPIQVRRSGHPVWPALLTHPVSGTRSLARPLPR
jgi:hypothetical protein